MFNAYHVHFKNQNVWPERLIIFRDGVSEGELSQVVEKEYSQIKRKFAAMDAHPHD